MEEQTEDIETQKDQKFPNKIDARPVALNRLMVVPIVMALFLAGATGLLVLKMTEDRMADGSRITLQLAGECLGEARSTIEQRAEAVGVGDPVFVNNEKGVLFTLTLPAIPNAEKDIPKLLTRKGIWTMRDGDTVLLSNENVSKAKLSLDESGMPETLLTFDPASVQEVQKYLEGHPSGTSQLFLDDEKIIDRPNSIPVSDDFRLVSTNTEPALRMKESADFVILLSNPVIECDIDWQIVKDPS